MFRPLRTVRAKLIALVSLSAVVMVAALPVLSWLLHRQLVDEVGSRVTDAERAFQSELEDKITGLTLASRVLADDEATARAVSRRDPVQARHLAEVFVSVYPSDDVLLFEDGGRILAAVGTEHPPDAIDAIAELGGLGQVPAGRSVSALIEHGCESPASAAPPAYGIGVPVGGGGVIVCAPLDRARLEKASTK